MSIFMEQLMNTLKWAAPWLAILAAIFIAKAILKALVKLLWQGLGGIARWDPFALVLGALVIVIVAAALCVAWASGCQYAVGERVMIAVEGHPLNGLSGVVRDTTFGKKECVVGVLWTDGSGKQQYNEREYHERDLGPRTERK